MAGEREGPLEDFKCEVLDLGAKLDADRLRFELARRGKSQGELAAAAGLTPETLSRGMRGRGLRPGTFAKVADALLSWPVLRGADLLQEPEKRVAAAATSAATPKEVSGGTRTTSAEA